MENIRVNGISMAYERRGRGAPLLLIHGFPLDHSAWKRLLPQLENDFEVITPDLRGFGESSAPETGYSLDDMAADLSALLAGLGLPAAFVAGHSMGGYIAMAFARRFGSQLLGLGILGSQAAPDTQERKLGRYENAEQIIKQGAAIQLGMAEKLSNNPENIPFFREIILRQNPAGLSNALKAMAERPDSLSVLSALTVPVVIVHGLSDVLVPVERAREIKSALPSAKLIELPGVGHSPFLDAPLQTAEALKQLL